MIFLLSTSTPDDTAPATKVELSPEQFAALGEQINGVGLFLGVGLCVLIAVCAGILWIMAVSGR